MFDFIGFGALNVDLVYSVDDLSNISVCGGTCEPGAEMFCGQSDFQGVMNQLAKHGQPKGRSAGGSAANTAVAMSRMGFEVGYIGQVGADENGSFILDSMTGVDVSRVKRAGVTGMTIVLLDPDGERSIIVLPNSNDDLTVNDIDAAYAADTKYLHLTSFAGEDPTTAQIQTVDGLPDSVKISFDPGEINTQKGLVKMLSVFRKSYAVFITDREVRLLTGEDYLDGAHELLNYGPEVIVCKLGKVGSYILTREQEFGVPSLAVKPVDKTGAGDVYAAGFIGGLLKGFPIIRCAYLANAVAARSITNWGREGYPDMTVFDEET